VKSYGAGLTGFTALLLAKLLRAKLIIELPGVPEDTYKYARFGDAYEYAAKPSLGTRLAKVGADLALRIVVACADRVQLLYPWQLQAYPKLRKVPASVIHVFSTISKTPKVEGEDGSVLLVGAPWYVKGVDLLIRAWRKIEHEFPNSKLRLMGNFPEKDLLREMCGDSRQIEFLKARPNPETLQLMASCSIFALASRTEAAGRVFLEAMAAGKPLVGPNLGGVAHYVRDGVNGFLFKSEDSDELAEKLRILLASPSLRAKFGAAGRKIATTEMSEAEFGRLVEEMFEETVYGEVRRPELKAKGQAVGAR
jgi:glycosyltransferase involved in cell wall biosynthesis